MNNKQNSFGTFETNFKKGLEISATLNKGVFLVTDICAPEHTNATLFKGSFDNAWQFYTTRVSPNFPITNLSQAEAFKIDNRELLISLQDEVNSIPNVAYSEIWLNGNAPHFVAGYDFDDNQIVSLRIQ